MTAPDLRSAYASRDPRFDGVFFIGVTSTGIYCRPVCPARPPRPSNTRYYDSAAAAEQAGLRPCLRCRPELAPGNAPVDGGRRIAGRLVQRIAEGMVDDGRGLDQIAGEFGLSTRQVRRIVRKELGVSPIELVLTRRLLLAKQLLTETVLPVTEIAYASGFGSLRRFNDAFLGRYRMPPTRFRKGAGAEPAAGETEAVSLQLTYRAPFDWAGLLAFLELRALAGAEAVAGDRYRRTVRLGSRSGWIEAGPAPKPRTLLVTLSHGLTPVLPALLDRLRHLFDLSARPDVIADALRRDPRLRPAVTRHPGLRVPGAFDGFELALRAILGQQVTVKGAATLAARVTAAFGQPLDTPYPELTRLAPTAERLASARPERLGALGIIRSRARSIVALAKEVAGGRLRLEPGADVADMVERLEALPGIGPWTAQYIAMRALRWPDAFPSRDLVVRQRLGGVSAARAEELSQPWRPWRAYATLYLWRG